MSIHEPQLDNLENMIGWGRATYAIRLIGGTDPKSIWPNSPTSFQVIRTALALRDSLSSWLTPPDSVYPIPDGNIVFEYRLENDVIVRYEAEPDGWVERMVSFGDGTKPIFYRFRVQLNRGAFCAVNKLHHGVLFDFSLAS
jgi:hypothetical protein